MSTRRVWHAGFRPSRSCGGGREIPRARGLYRNALAVARSLGRILMPLALGARAFGGGRQGRPGNAAACGAGRGALPLAGNAQGRRGRAPRPWPMVLACWMYLKRRCPAPPQNARAWVGCVALFLTMGAGMLDSVAALLARDVEKRWLVAFVRRMTLPCLWQGGAGYVLGGAALPHGKMRGHGLDAWPCS